MKKIIYFVMLLIATGQLAFSTTLVRMDLDDLTAQSHAVAQGTITASRTEWDRSHSIIFTIYTVNANEYLKGQLGATFELKEPGGELDGIAVKVDSVPIFNVGDEAVLFVWTDGEGNHQAIGFEQGAVAVQTDPATGQKTADRTIRLGSARGSVSNAATPPTTSRTLPQLFNQIRASVAKTGAVKQ